MPGGGGGDDAGRDTGAQLTIRLPYDDKTFLLFNLLHAAESGMLQNTGGVPGGSGGDDAGGLQPPYNS